MTAKGTPEIGTDGPKRTRRGPFEAHDQGRDGESGRIGNKQVNMVGLAVELDEARPKVIAGVAEEFFEAGQMLLTEDLAAVLGHEHEVGME